MPPRMNLEKTTLANQPCHYGLRFSRGVGGSFKTERDWSLTSNRPQLSKSQRPKHPRRQRDQNPQRQDRKVHRMFLRKVRGLLHRPLQRIAHRPGHLGAVLDHLDDAAQDRLRDVFRPAGRADDVVELVLEGGAGLFGGAEDGDDLGGDVFGGAGRRGRGREQGFFTAISRGVERWGALFVGGEAGARVGWWGGGASEAASDSGEEIHD